jgi:hypothetical protein
MNLIELFVQVFKALKGLVLFVMFSYHTPDGKNPLWNFIGYPGETSELRWGSRNTK